MKARTKKNIFFISLVNLSMWLLVMLDFIMKKKKKIKLRMLRAKRLKLILFYIDFEAIY